MLMFWTEVHHVHPQINQPAFDENHVRKVVMPFATILAQHGSLQDWKT